MSIPAPYAKVIQGLLDKSIAQKVVWDTTTDPNTFIVYFDKSSLSIRQDHSFNDETWIAVDLISVCPQSRLLCGQTLHFLA